VIIINDLAGWSLSFFEILRNLSNGHFIKLETTLQKHSKNPILYMKRKNDTFDFGSFWNEKMIEQGYYFPNMIVMSEELLLKKNILPGKYVWIIEGKLSIWNMEMDFAVQVANGDLFYKNIYSAPVLYSKTRKYDPEQITEQIYDLPGEFVRKLKYVFLYSDEPTNYENPYDVWDNKWIILKVSDQEYKPVTYFTSEWSTKQLLNSKYCIK
jgi:hypothetical protein